MQCYINLLVYYCIHILVHYYIITLLQYYMIALLSFDVVILTQHLYYYIVRPDLFSTSGVLSVCVPV